MLPPCWDCRFGYSISVNLTSRMRQNPVIAICTLAAFSLYWLTVALQDTDTVRQNARTAELVISAPIQVLLYGGDRFIAADIESIRATVASTDQNANDFRLRAHQTVSRLNPCHEDNYWIGNAALSWGGAEELGFELLNNAMHCRFWDEWPAFFYGFNQHFFRQDIAEAQKALAIAAQRSKSNSAAFRTFATMIEVEKVDNTRMALKMLADERDKAKDKKLRDMLEKRVVRLTGLLTLREAQEDFEKRYKRPLKQPQELLDTGLISKFPDDPMGLGYEFRNNTFHLRQMKF